MADALKPSFRDEWLIILRILFSERKLTFKECIEIRNQLVLISFLSAPQIKPIIISHFNDNLPYNEQNNFRKEKKRDQCPLTLRKKIMKFAQKQKRTVTPSFAVTYKPKNYVWAN